MTKQMLSTDLQYPTEAGGYPTSGSLTRMEVSSDGSQAASWTPEVTQMAVGGRVGGAGIKRRKRR